MFNINMISLFFHAIPGISSSGVFFPPIYKGALVGQSALKGALNRMLALRPHNVPFCSKMTLGVDFMCVRGEVE